MRITLRPDVHEAMEGIYECTATQNRKIVADREKEL